MSDDFDWSQDASEDDCIVARAQDAVAVYFNPKGEIVIRRQQRWDEDEDVFVWVQVEAAEAVARRLLELVDYHHEKLGLITEPAQPGSPSPAAQRQRRYRQNRRHSVTPPATQGVTRNAPPITEEMPDLLMAAE